MSKTYSSVLAAVYASLLFCAMPAWAGPGHHFGAGHHTSGKNLIKNTGPGKNLSSTVDSDDSGGVDIDADAHPGSNKGDVLRGLQRANEVAGEHGELGRTNAAHHGHH
jgi:hypothetical protein